MRLFSHEHSFPRPWSVVSAASWQKYPNPEWTPHVTNVDYLSCSLDQHGRLHTERLLTCQQSIPPFLGRLLGAATPPASIVYERSTVDPEKREMRLETRNLSFAHLMVVEETCLYRQSADCQDSTLFSQECRIKSVHGWSWLAGQIEDLCVSRFQANAQRGRRALEEAIADIDRAVSQLALWCDDAGK